MSCIALHHAKASGFLVNRVDRPRLMSPVGAG
jgi:hypothetical protein